MVTRLGYFMGMDFGPNVIAHLHQRFGGHPFFIRQVCSQVHRSISTSRPRTISIAACKDAERDAGADIQGYMSEILTTLKTFYPDEHTMIEYLAKGDRVNFNDLAAYDPAYIEHLIGYGLVVRRGDDYEFGFDAIKEAVEKRLIKSASADLEDRWSEISKRRNRIEEEIRVALFHWSTKFNATEWAETVKKCVTTKRLGELGPINHREAFSKNSSPLYWIELLKFVDISGKFESNESSARIVSAMNIINAHRADAHAKAIAEQHYQDVLKALDFLEDVFLPPP